MKLIALDVGSKRIGVAKADSAVRIAIPAGAIEVDGTEMEQIASFARVYGTDFFIIGLPRNAKGEETAQSSYVRQFAKSLKRAIPEAKIRLQDESLTSVLAEERLDKRHKKYTKGDIDAEAATIILQDFLENFTEKGQKKPQIAESNPDKPVKPKKSHKLRNTLISLLAVLIVLGVGGYAFYRVNLLPVMPNVDCSIDTTNTACNDITFAVAEGEGVDTIADHLQSAGIVRNSLVFQVRLRLAYNGQSLKTGEYQLNKTLYTDQVIEQLIAGATDHVFRMTFVPGETIASIKSKLVEQGYEEKVVSEAFAKMARASSTSEDGTPIYDYAVLAGKPADASLEGYIFGDTYEFYKEDPVEKIIATALESLEQVVTENGLVEAYAANGLNLYQGITLASLVEGEVGSTTDQSAVAQVFYNRLAEGMSLGSDAAAKYAADLVDPDRTTYTDNAAVLQIDSPYNTRLYAGLPYGPICNPGLDTLINTARPAEHTYLFFLTGDDGGVYYSHTDSEHQQNIAEHCKELCKTSL